MVRTASGLVDAVRAITTSAGFFGDHPSAPQTEDVIDSFSHDGIHEVLAVSCYDKGISADGDFVCERTEWLPLEDVRFR